MRKFAHIIHPCLPPAGSDLHLAQPITFATMRTAHTFAQGQVDVQLYAVKQQDEAFAIPSGFIATPDLTRTVCEVSSFGIKRPLALIGDILERLYAVAIDAEYLIYTNVDIALQPYFYLAVNNLLDQGYDALIINRRTITTPYQSITEVPLMYAEEGIPHGGYDCFVFKRTVYPSYQLGNICIGAVGIGAALGVNMLYHAANFKEFTDLHLTFHLGDERIWRTDQYQDYARHNWQEFCQILHQYQTMSPAFQHPFIRTAEANLRYALGEPGQSANVKHTLLGRLSHQVSHQVSRRLRQRLSLLQSYRQPKEAR